MSPVALSDSVMARAVARLDHYLRLHPLPECCETTARGAYLTGWDDAYPRGAQDMRKACSDLASSLHQFEDAAARIAHMCELLRDPEGGS